MPPETVKLSRKLYLIGQHKSDTELTYISTRLQQCGNGILEPGEECDPGQGATSDCCDSSTCKLRAGAQCDPATNTCCSSTCTYAPSGQVCRPAITETCDIAETCTGTSADCPPDETKADGTSCGDNGLKCASGYCTSKNEQCASLGASMGITQACPNVGDSSCEVTCQSPNSALSCIILQGQYFIEGTECGYGGHCRDGRCQSGSWQDTVASWYTDVSFPNHAVFCASKPMNSGGEVYEAKILS